MVPQQPDFAHLTAPSGRRHGPNPIELFNELGRTYRGLRGSLNERLRRWQLTDSECLLLCTCESRSPAVVAQHDLADAVGVSAAQMSGLVEKLRRRGLLIACRDERDRRRQLWGLTTAGREVVRDIRRHLAGSSQALVGGLSPREQQTLVSLLGRLAQEEPPPARQREGDGPWINMPGSVEDDDDNAHRRAS
jgi:DNA-binding MarR family transcriptional regulator